jgi:hypothetical protein
VNTNRPLVCDHCREMTMTKLIKVLRTKSILLCRSCRKEAYKFEVLSADEIKSLPDYGLGSGVYFLWNGNDLRYIGQSFNVCNRVRQHENALNIDFDRYTFLEVEDARPPLDSHYDTSERLRDIRLIRERAYIEKFRPTFNDEWFLHQ